MQSSLSTILNTGILGNTIYDFVMALIVFLGAVLVFRVLQSVLLSLASKRADQTKTEIDNAILDIIKSLRPPFYTFLAFYVALNWIYLEGWVQGFVDAVFVIWLVWQVLMSLQILIGYITGRITKRETDEGSKTAVEMVGMVAKITLWFIGVLFVLSNLGVNITSLVAGLGIGGIAVALAAQNILGDLFSSFVIFFDKPFVRGDFIKAGDVSGTVKKIGIKTTRLKSLQGEEIIISNKKLTANTIKNFKRMAKRRADFQLGLAYETPTDKLKQVPRIIKEIINSVPLAKCGRVVFREFGDSSLIFTVDYDIESRKFDDYMQVQNDINYKLKSKFAELSIELAYPTQKVYLQSNQNISEKN